MTKKNPKTSNRQRKNVRRTATSKPVSGARLPWFIAGLFCGIAVMVILDFKPWSDNAITGPSSEKLANEADQVAKPRFDFYTLLRESEVIVSDADEPAEDIQIIDKSSDTVLINKKQSSDIYVLQVGSFKSPNDADSLRVGLLLLNLQASIEKVSPQGGETWHRVLVGPMSSRSQVAEAREKLSSNKIDSLLLKRTR